MSTLATTSVIPLYAGFWRRVAAAFLDALVLVIPVVIVTLLIKEEVLRDLVGVFVGFAYFAGFHSSRLQATPGKKAFGIKVTNQQGERIGLGRAIARHFAVWLSWIILGIGFLLAGFTRKRQALHDMIGRTFVVNVSAPPDEIVSGGGVMPVTVGVKIVAAIFVVLPFLAGMLAAIAFPAYQDYTIRARVLEAVLATSQCRTAVSEIYQTSKATSIGTDNWGCGEGSITTPYVSRVSTSDNGAITVTLSANEVLGGAKNRTLSLTPTDAAGVALTWSGTGEVRVSGFKCAPGRANPIPNKYLPQACRE